MSATNTPTRHHGGTSQLLLTPKPSLKRGSTDGGTPPAPKKQFQEHSTLGMDNSMQLIRRTADGMDIPLEQALNLTNAMADDQEDMFVDAPEDHVEEAPQVRPEVLDTLESDAEQDADHAMSGADDDDDLFSKIQLGNGRSATIDGDDDDDNASDQEAEDDGGTHRVVECDCAEGEHDTHCRNNRSASTPPGSPSQIIKRERSRSSSVEITGSKVKAPPPKRLPHQSNPEKDYSQQLISFKRWHDRMKHLIPRLHLEPHRYWIGVLPFDREPRTATQEKHLTWMKGNRLTTVSTIWHAQNVLSVDNDQFDLTLGNEKLKFTDRAEELDHFNDKFICLRAVLRKEVKKKVRPVTDGLVPRIVVPQVVVLDD